MKNAILPLLILLLSGASPLSAKEPVPANLNDLIQQIQSHPDQDFSKFIGRTFKLEGELVGERKDPLTIRVEIHVPAPDGKTNVDSGILAVITMGDTSKVIHFPGGDLAIGSTGILQSVDAKSKTITIKSDPNSTYVTEAD